MVAADWCPSSSTTSVQLLRMVEAVTPGLKREKPPRLLMAACRKVFRGTLPCSNYISIRA
jgi:hypothetical protein